LLKDVMSRRESIEKLILKREGEADLNDNSLSNRVVAVEVREKGVGERENKVKGIEEREKKARESIARGKLAIGGVKVVVGIWKVRRGLVEWGWRKWVAKMRESAIEERVREVEGRENEVREKEGGFKARLRSTGGREMVRRVEGCVREGRERGLRRAWGLWWRMAVEGRVVEERERNR